MTHVPSDGKGVRKEEQSRGREPLPSTRQAEEEQRNKKKKKQQYPMWEHRCSWLVALGQSGVPSQGADRGADRGEARENDARACAHMCGHFP